jgi:uncharacterized phiE125 gp8 family phage protein
MPTKSTTLFSLAKVKAHLDIKSANTEQDALLTNLADGVSERCEQMTARVFVTRNIVETIDARGRDTAFLRHMPVASVSLVRRRASMSSAWETIGSSGYELDGFVGRLFLKDQSFYAGPRTAEITYSAGYDTQDGAALPSGLVMAALEYVNFVYKRKSIGGPIFSSATVGGNSVLVVPEPPKDIRDAIMSHRKFRGVGIG